MSNTFFQGGRKFSRGGLAPLVTSLVVQTTVFQVGQVSESSECVAKPRGTQ